MLEPHALHAHHDADRHSVLDGRDQPGGLLPVKRHFALAAFKDSLGVKEPAVFGDMQKASSACMFGQPSKPLHPPLLSSSLALSSPVNTFQPRERMVFGFPSDSFSVQGVYGGVEQFWRIFERVLLIVLKRLSQPLQLPSTVPLQPPLKPSLKLL